MNIKKLANQDHIGFGGLILMLVSIISGITMLYAVTLSWNSNAVAMADNIAYISTVNTANDLYLSRVNSFNYSDTTDTIRTPTGKVIDPMGRYRKMLVSTELVKGGTPTPTHYAIKWDKNKGTCTIQYQGFKTTVGDTITPHKQSSVIENN